MPFGLASRQLNLQATDPTHQNQLPPNSRVFAFDELSSLCSCSRETNKEIQSTPFETEPIILDKLPLIPKPYTDTKL